MWEKYEIVREKQMKSGKTRVFWILAIVLIAIVGFRVVTNVMARSDKAKKSRQGTVVSVVAEHPKRQTVVPKIRFSGTLQPVWQADVAAKVDGRIERVLVEEGQSVQAGDDLVVLEQRDMSAALLAAEGAYVDARTTLEKTALDLERYEKLYAGLCSRMKCESISVVGHGDLCFSNMLFDKNTELLMLIDPKGALNEAEIWTDPYYDIAKLSHSICGMYDLFNNGLYSLDIDDDLKPRLEIDFDNREYEKRFGA